MSIAKNTPDFIVIVRNSVSVIDVALSVYAP